MGFRGVLLKLAEAEEETHRWFRVVAPDAQLTLPIATTSSTLRADEKLLVTDFVSSRVLQVTRCAAVSLQRETKSALWVATLPRQKTPLPQEHTGGGCLQHQQQTSTSGTNSIKRPMIAPWDPMIGHQIQGGVAVAARICYCFQFRSSVEYEMFERTIQAYVRIQCMALLEQSVLMEIEIQNEIEMEKKTKKKAAANTASGNTASSSKRSDRSRSAQSGNAAARGMREDPQHRQLLSREELRGSASASRQTSRTQGNAAAMSRSVQRNRMVNTSTSNGPKVLRELAATVMKGGSSRATAKGSGRPVKTAPIPLDPNVQCVLCRTKQSQTLKPFSKHPFVLQVRNQLLLSTLPWIARLSHLCFLCVCVCGGHGNILFRMLEERKCIYAWFVWSKCCDDA